MAEQDPAYGSGATDPNAPIGTAFMREDGVIEMMLRAQSADGTFGEAMIVVAYRPAPSGLLNSYNSSMVLPKQCIMSKTSMGLRPSLPGLSSISRFSSGFYSLPRFPDSGTSC